MMKKMVCWLLIWRSVPAFIAYITSGCDTKRKIDMDMQVIGLNANLLNLHELLLFNVVFRRQFFTRIFMESEKKYRLVRWTYKPLESLEISAESRKIGGGLRIFHGYSTIICCYSMGENCSVYQNVTIGRGKMIEGIDVPQIGNNVSIYAGAIVVGGIKIGDNVKIGAGTVVTTDVPANTTVVGAKMRMIQS